MPNNLMVENNKSVFGAVPKSYSSAAMTAQYVSMKNYGHLTIIITTGAWAAGTAAVTLAQATAIAGTGTKALAMAYYWLGTLTDDALVKTAVTSDTFNLSAASKLVVIEVDAEDLDVDNGFDCVTLEVASPGANADFYNVVYVLSQPRYSQPTPPTALSD